MHLLVTSRARSSGAGARASSPAIMEILSERCRACLHVCAGVCGDIAHARRMRKENGERIPPLMGSTKGLDTVPWAALKGWTTVDGQDRVARILQHLLRQVHRVEIVTSVISPAASVTASSLGITKPV